MQQYFITDKDFNENIITGNDVFHVINVVKLKIGEQIVIAANEKRYLAAITSLANDKVGFKIINNLPDNEPKSKITLIQGMAKGDKIEDIIKYSTSLGVSEIIITNMVRSIAVLDENKFNKKVSRYNKIAKEEAEVAKRSIIPTIKFMKFSDILKLEYDLKLLLDEDENTVSLKQFENPCAQSISLIIGPEGGLADSERKLASANNYKPINIGARILRTELAGISALAMLIYAKELE